MKVNIVIGLCITIAIAAETARAESTPPLVSSSCGNRCFAP